MLGCVAAPLTARALDPVLIYVESWAQKHSKFIYSSEMIFAKLSKDAINILSLSFCERGKQISGLNRA